MSYKFCSYCGAQIEATAVTCPCCGGTSLDNQGNTQTNPQNIAYASNPQFLTHAQKNKWVAFLLCLFLGYLGIHKFYEGKTIAGIIYLFTLGLFGVGWLVDCIILLFKPNPYFV